MGSLFNVESDGHYRLQNTSILDSFLELFNYKSKGRWVIKKISENKSQVYSDNIKSLFYVASLFQWFSRNANSESASSLPQPTPEPRDGALPKRLDQFGGVTHERQHRLESHRPIRHGHDQESLRRRHLAPSQKGKSVVSLLIKSIELVE